MTMIKRLSGLPPGIFVLGEFAFSVHNRSSGFVTRSLTATLSGMQSL